jgi:hypothetical protein
MSPTAASPRGTAIPPRWEPASPGLAIIPGALVLLAGALMLTEGGPPLLAWACAVLGQTLLLLGVIAKGVAWGLDLRGSGRA